MKTKVEAAKKAAERGIDTIILNATKSDVFDQLLNNDVTGTIFKKTSNPLTAKKHWMLHALSTSGKILIDTGAAKAVIEKGASLLPSGILNVEGDFKQGDAVNILSKEGKLIKDIAKGISQYNSVDLNKIKGRKSSEIESILGYITTDEIVNRDELVLTEEL